MSALTHGFELEGLQVSPLTGEVSGPGGIAQLDPKVMAVLVLMAEHPGDVMLREDLVSRLWGNVVVTDDALTRCFYELRRQLSQAGGDERFRNLIETLPKRGYRLNASVRPGAPSPDPGAAGGPRERQHWVSWAALAMVLISGAIAGVFYWKSLHRSPDLASAATTHSIAVLPFLDMSEKKDQRYLADGVTEEILNHLSQSRNLRVISRTSSFLMRDEPLDVPEIAARLGVDYVLEGSVRRSGERVRITAQLIDAANNVHIWSRTFDRGVDDLFAVQDEIATSVAAQLQVSLADDGVTERPPASADAHERFLQGQFHYNRRSPGDIELAVQYYKQAVTLDPGYARAWAALAGGYSLLAAGGTVDDASFRGLQGEAAKKAVALDPDLAVANARLAQFYYQMQQRDQGDAYLTKAIALDPDDPLVLGFRSGDATWRGDMEEAVRIWRQLVAQDPLSAVSRGNLSYMLYASGRLEEALAESRRVQELNPADPDVGVDISRNLILLGRYDEALAEIAQMPRGKDRDYVTALLHRAPGRAAEADAALERLATGDLGTIEIVYLAEAHVYRGNSEEAFGVLQAYDESLKRNHERNPPERWYFEDEIRMSPLLRPLHTDSRWAGLTDVRARR